MVNILLRVYPRISKEPIGGFVNKLQLFQVSLRSLRNFAQGVRVNFVILMDGCGKDFEELVLFELSGLNVEFEYYSSIGNVGTFLRQIDLATRYPDDEYVLLAEDDYLWIPGGLVKILDSGLLNNGFITPYDHPDYYTRPEHMMTKGCCVCSAGMKWSTQVSTCLTFMGKAGLIKRHRRHFFSYQFGITDHALWIVITGLRPDLIRYDGWNLSKLKLMIKVMYCFVYGGARWRLNTKLYSPAPSLATHMERAYIAPGVDWEAELLRLNRTS